MRIFLILIFCLFLNACDDNAEQETTNITAEETVNAEEELPPKFILTAASFDDLPGWGDDDFDGFAQAFSRSCHAIRFKTPDVNFGVMEGAKTYGLWLEKCKIFADVKTAAEHKLFFETHFLPYRISADDNPIGLFTGYYEASLKGSKVKTDRYNIPLHKRPDDLVMVQLGDFREDLKGIRIAGRVKNGQLKPYESRKDIVAGNWPHNDETLIWVDNAVDAFFVQIQGSGLVEMADGSLMRIGYDGQNGHPYYAIGRELIKIGALNKGEVSMQSIRQWLDENPDQADDIMNTNASYVFFKEISGDGPIGAQGVALTEQRSLAVDRTLVSYGLPLWVDIEHPDKAQPNLTRMMIAQDTGGAIIGAVRGDVFWGHGKYAEEMAGKMNSKGRYWALLPRENN